MTTMKRMIMADKRRLGFAGLFFQIYLFACFYLSELANFRCYAADSSFYMCVWLFRRGGGEKKRAAFIVGRTCVWPEKLCALKWGSKTIPGPDFRLHLIISFLVISSLATSSVVWHCMRFPRFIRGFYFCFRYYYLWSNLSALLFCCQKSVLIF